uniref:C2H2-type domain-containing protein n=1 Tax=Lepeophtheirus salmonis TaxID=72036 RepID=A0A0K2UQK9_LEPSM
MAMPLCESCKGLETISSEGIKYVSKVVQTTPHLARRLIHLSKEEDIPSFSSASSSFTTSSVIPSATLNINNSSNSPKNKKKSNIFKGAFKSIICSINGFMFPNNRVKGVDQSKKWLSNGMKKLQMDYNSNIESSSFIEDISIETENRGKLNNTKDSDDNNMEEMEDDADIYWGRDSNACVVCERIFFTIKQLERHQLKKRHYGCNECEQRFNTLMLLEYHKEEYDHWTDDELSSADDYDSEDSYNPMDSNDVDDISGDEEKEYLLL